MTELEAAYQAARSALARAAESDLQWPTAVVCVPELGFMALVDGRGLLLRGPQAPAVCERLQAEGQGGVIETDPQPIGGYFWEVRP